MHVPRGVQHIVGSTVVAAYGHVCIVPFLFVLVGGVHQKIGVVRAQDARTGATNLVPCEEETETQNKLKNCKKLCEVRKKTDLCVAEMQNVTLLQRLHKQ